MATFDSPDIPAALARPTVSTVDPKTGHAFDTTSPEWKTMCAALPSFGGLAWPGYATTIFEVTIDGVEVVIQPWMGRCEQFMGRCNFPGGVGGEVGVYVRVPRGRPLPDVGQLPPATRAPLEGLHLIAGDKYWWPHPDMQPEIDFTILNPLTDTVFLHADMEKHYWVNKWMQPDSYERYVKDCGGRVPPVTQFKMVLRVGDVVKEWVGLPPAVA